MNQNERYLHLIAINIAHFHNFNLLQTTTNILIFASKTTPSGDSLKAFRAKSLHKEPCRPAKNHHHPKEVKTIKNQ